MNYQKYFNLKIFSFNEQLNLKRYPKLLKFYSIKNILEIIVYLNIKVTWILRIVWVWLYFLLLNGY